MFLSVVIPAYNEEKSLPSTLKRIYTFLSKNYDYEVIIVDDGSSDKTKEVILKSSIAYMDKLTLLENEYNRGKGFSVKRGILASRGDYVLFTDADLSTPIEEIEKFFIYINSGFDIVIGSRRSSDSFIRVKQTWYREALGRVFNFFVRLLLIKEFNDTQCGFKLFKGYVARIIAEAIKINGFAFDVEMLYLAKKHGYKIAEVGVIWEDQLKSKVKLIRTPLCMFFELFKIKFLHK